MTYILATLGKVAIAIETIETDKEKQAEIKRYLKGLCDLLNQTDEEKDWDTLIQLSPTI